MHSGDVPLRLLSLLALFLPLPGSLASEPDSAYFLGASEANDSKRISEKGEVDEFLSKFLSPDSSMSTMLAVYRPWSVYKQSHLTVARALHTWLRPTAPTIAVYECHNWEPDNALLREWLRRNVPDIWPGKYMSLMLRVQGGRVVRGSTHAAQATKCPHCLLRTLYGEGEHNLPKSDDASCAPASYLHDGVSWTGDWSCSSVTEL
ncbi:unnamed protein product [Symbiodinium natans]|uniref:Uncharacterized protein n=1 Tax=Symbiodinium natans TaxID=878477 RepID=A0A812T183_9DINO|nr:unnamed protein product [Symbiodinium natans]